MHDSLHVTSHAPPSHWLYELLPLPPVSPAYSPSLRSLLHVLWPLAVGPPIYQSYMPPPLPSVASPVDRRDIRSSLADYLLTVCLCPLVALAPHFSAIYLSPLLSSCGAVSLSDGILWW